MNRNWRSRLMILAMVYFTFLGGTFVTDLDFWPRVVHHIIVTAIIAGWLISHWRRQKQIPVTPLDIPILLVFLAYAVATLFAIDPRVSVEALWQVGVHIAFFYILVDIIRAWQPRAVFEPVFFSAAVVVVVGLAEFISWYFGLKWLSMFQQSWFEIGGLANPIPPIIYRLSFTLGVSTSLSGYLALLIPVALGWALSTPSPDARKGLVLWIVAALVVMVLSFSRGGLLSLAVSLPLFTVLILIGQPERRQWLIRMLRGWRLAAALGVAAILVAGVVLAWLRSNVTGGHAAGDDIRRNLFDSAWQVGLAHPITGVGPGGFGRAMRPYRDQLITGDHFTGAHDVPLQIWAEEGLVGLVPFACLVSVGLWISFRRWRDSSGSERIRVAGIAAALVGFAVNNLVDIFTNLPLVIPWLACVAYLVMPLRPAGPSRSPVRQVFQNLMALLVLVSIGGWAISDLAQYHFNRAVQLAATGDLDSALDAIQTARRIDPAMGYYVFQRAQYLGVLSADQPAVLPKAVDAYRSALALERTYALNNANYAILLQQSGDLDGAVSQMQEAIAWQINDPRYVLGYAVFADLHGDSAVALDAYRNALELDPAWVESPFWDLTPLRAQARADFLELRGLQHLSAGTLGALPPDCWPVTAAASSNSSVSLSLNSSAYCRAERSLKLDGKVSDAIEQAGEAIQLDPSNPRAYLLRASAYEIGGDPQRAEVDAKTALFLQDIHAYAILGRLAEDRGDLKAAEQYYLAGGPLVVQLQGWDVATYARRGDLYMLPQLDLPGPSRYDFAAWDALVALYQRQGRTGDSQQIRDIILEFDPYHQF